MKKEKTPEEFLIEILNTRYIQARCGRCGEGTSFRIAPYVLHKDALEAVAITKKQFYCKACGFPKDMARDILILDCNPVSYLCAEENTCKTCGHQKDGSTILKLQPYRRKLVEEVEKRVRKEFSPQKVSSMMKSMDIFKREIELAKKQEKEKIQTALHDHTMHCPCNAEIEEKQKCEQCKKKKPTICWLCSDLMQALALKAGEEIKENDLEKYDANDLLKAKVLIQEGKIVSKAEMANGFFIPFSDCGIAFIKLTRETEKRVRQETTKKLYDWLKSKGPADNSGLLQREELFAKVLIREFEWRFLKEEKKRKKKL